MSDAIEIADGILFLQADLNDARPMASLEKSRKSTADQFPALAAAFLQKIRNRPADDLLKISAHKIGKAAIHSPDFAIQRTGHENVVERIDEVAVPLLRAGNDIEELIELPVAGRGGIVVLQPANQPPQFGDFLRAPPGIETKKCDEDDEANRKSFKAMGERTNSAPRGESKDDGKHKEENEGQPPQFILAFFELLEAGRNRGAAGTARR